MKQEAADFDICPYRSEKNECTASKKYDLKRDANGKYVPKKEQ